MAKDRQSDKSLEQLRQEIAHSRDRLQRDLSGLSYELDFPLKFRKSFQRHSKIWISVVTLLGALFTMRPSRPKKLARSRASNSAEAEKKGLLAAGLAMGGLRFAATLLRPLLIKFVTQKVRDYTATGRAR